MNRVSGPLALFLVAGATLVWAMSLAYVDVRAMSDLGLVSVLSPWTYFALAILTASFCVNVYYRETRMTILLPHLAAVILIVHGTPHLLYGTLRYSWAWKHVAIIDYIQRYGFVDPYAAYLDVYHNWPGFFALNALITEIAGLKSAMTYAGWGPVFFNTVNIGALWLVLRSFTPDRRLIWTSVWFFFLANWIGQDYFAPQALTYFLYLVVLGITLNWFRIRATPSEQALQHWVRSERLAATLHKVMARSGRDQTAPTRSRRWQRMELIIVIFLIMVTIASTHQLTPLIMISALAFLVISQIIKPRSLPILMGVLTASWFMIMAEPFMNHSLYWIVRSIGEFLGNFRANFIDLAEASPGQALIAQIDRALSAFVGALAMLGFFRRIRRGRWDLPALLLMISPFPLLAANSYGGEMVFRVYLFALPFLAFLAAAAFYPKHDSGSHRWTPLLLILVSMLMLAGLLFGYYGKERQYFFTEDEVAAAEYISSAAPEGSFLIDGGWGYSLQYKNYEWYDYLSLVSMSHEDRLDLIADPVEFLAQAMQGYPQAYLVLSRSQKALVDMTGVMPAGTLQDIERALKASDQFEVIYSNRDAAVFAPARQAGGAAE